LAGAATAIALGVGAASGGAVPIQVVEVEASSRAAPDVRLAANNGQVWGLDRKERQVVSLDAVAQRPVGEPIPLPPEVAQPREIAAGQTSLWVISPADDVLVRIDPAARRVLDAAIPVGPRPVAVATGFGSVWVGNAGGGTLDRLDESAGTRMASVQLGGSPVAIAIGPRFVWVGLRNGNVVAIDPKRNRRNGRPVRVGQGIGQMAVGAGAVYATRFRANKVARFAIRTRKVAGTISTNRPRGVAVFGGRVWVGVWRLDVIERYDPKTSRRVAQRLRAWSPTQLLATPAGVWAAASGATFFRPLRERLTGALIGTEGFEEKDRDPLAVGPSAVWIGNTSSNTLTELSPQTDAPEGRRIPVGVDPATVAVGAGALWVANSGENTVSRLDPETGAELGPRVPVPGRPRSIVPAGSGVWVSAGGDQSTAVRIDAAGTLSTPAEGSSIGGATALASGPSGFWGAVQTGTESGSPIFGGLQRFDPVTGANVGDAINLEGTIPTLAVGEGAVWVLRSQGLDSQTLDRVDLASGRVSASVAVPSGGAFVHRDGRGSIWVAGPGDLLVQVDEATAQLVGFPTATADPTGWAFRFRSPVGLASGFGSVWVSQRFLGGEVLRVDPTRKRIPGRSSQAWLRPRDVAFGPAGVWAVDGESTNLVELNARTGRPIGKRIRLGGSPTQVVVGTGAVWVLDGRNRRIVRVDPARRKVVKRLRVGSRPTAIDASGRVVWVLDRGGKLRGVSQATNRVTASISVVVGGTGLAASGSKVYVASGPRDRLQRIDAKRKRLTAQTTADLFDPKLAVGGGRVWVADEESGTVLRFDAASLRRQGTSPVGAWASAIATGGGLVWVTDELNSTLVRLNGTTGAPVGPAIPVGEEPTGVAFGAGAVWVAAFSDGIVTRIPASRS
jgi:DNA-binding beta-propeller fold protein YncE